MSVARSASDALPRYRPDIDGLRAIAVTSVVAYHAGIPFVSGGFAGVDVFFVISGYLIGSIIDRQVTEGSFSFAAFYARRARRIIPALLALLIAVSLAGLAFLTPLELTSFSKSALATAFAVSNIWFWASTNYFSAAAELKPLMMTWSLGVEEQFYVLLPPFLIFVSRLAPRRVVLVTAIATAVSFGVAIWITGRYPAAAFFLLPARSWELGFGVLLGMFELRWTDAAARVRAKYADVASVVGICIVAGSFIVLSSNTPFPGFAALLPVSGAAMLLFAAGGAVNRTLLSATPIVFVGQVSYSWYLWHWPLLAFARLSADRPLEPFIGILIATISFALAVLSWKFVEQPFRRMRKSHTAAFRGYAFAMASVAAIALILGSRHGWPNRFSPALSKIEREGVALQEDRCLAGYGVTQPATAAGCMDLTRTRVLALIGDSHAAALGPAARAVAEHAGLGFEQLTKSSCPTLAKLSRRMPTHPLHESECSAFNAKALALVERPEVRVVVIAGYWAAPFVEEASGSRFVLDRQDGRFVTPKESRQNLLTALEDTVATLQRMGKTVVVVRDVPLFDFDPLRHIESGYIPVRAVLRPMLSKTGEIGNLSAPEADLLPGRRDSEVILNRLAADFPSTTILDPYATFCNSTSCSFADRSSVYYCDSQHLSLRGAELALAGLRIGTRRVVPEIKFATSGRPSSGILGL